MGAHDRDARADADLRVRPSTTRVVTKASIGFGAGWPRLLAPSRPAKLEFERVLKRQTSRPKPHLLRRRSRVGRLLVDIGDELLELLLDLGVLGIVDRPQRRSSKDLQLRGIRALLVGEDAYLAPREGVVDGFGTGLGEGELVLLGSFKKRRDDLPAEPQCVVVIFAIMSAAVPITVPPPPPPPPPPPEPIRLPNAASSAASAAVAVRAVRTRAIRARAVRELPPAGRAPVPFVPPVDPSAAPDPPPPVPDSSMPLP